MYNSWEGKESLRGGMQKQIRSPEAAEEWLSEDAKLCSNLLPCEINVYHSIWD